MVRDYFSIYSKESLFLLRIHHKVDFADEIAWARCWNNEASEELFSFVAEYLINGFDVLEKWDCLDNAAYHESIKHLGFKEELVEMNLIPLTISGHNPMVGSINGLLSMRRGETRKIKIPTYVGALTKALSEIGQPAKHPRDPFATLEVPINIVFDKNWDGLVEQVNNFCA